MVCAEAISAKQFLQSNSPSGFPDFLQPKQSAGKKMSRISFTAFLINISWVCSCVIILRNMSFFQSFFGASSCLGVDIGTTSIKLVEVGHAANRYKLKNYGLLESYGHLERLNDAIQTSSLKIFEKETINLLNLLLEKVRPDSNKAIVSIPAFSSFVTLLEIPEMSDSETAQAVPFQARQYIPLPVSEVAIDWLKVGTREDEKGVQKQQVLLIAVPNEQIRKYQQIFKAVGLNLAFLEIEALALTRALINGDPTPTMIVDIGSRSTAFLIADQGYLKLVSQNDFAGGTLTQTLANGLNIDVRRAEDLKKQRGILGSGGEYELSTLLLPYLDVIISEAKRLKERYEGEYQGKIERVVLTGGGALLLGIEKYFREQLGLPVVKANAFGRIDYPSMLEPIVDTLGLTFSVSIGLAMRGFL